MASKVDANTGGECGGFKSINPLYMLLQLLVEYDEDFAAILSKEQRDVLVGLKHVSMDVQQAAILWLRLNLTQRQWNGIARGLNDLLGEKKHAGGILPVVNTMKKECASLMLLQTEICVCAYNCAFLPLHCLNTAA